MLLEDAKLKITCSDNFKQSQFGIHISPKAFKVLSGTIYSDKIQAIVRELGTNAADAHVAAGKADVPFTVHLPNMLEPYFSIKDSGTGISPENIESLYTVYFKSDKTNSNDFTGCLGLGSKTPFNYVDTFNVVSTYNGKSYHYVAFINEDGLPSISQMTVQDTNEPNGLEVSFAVKSVDFDAFRIKAQEAYTFFKVRPIINGNTVAFPDQAPNYTGKTWKVYTKSSNYKNVLIMGNVAYPICTTQGRCRHNLFDSVVIHIECNIGEADMTASREALEYTDKTLATIKKSVDEVLTLWSKMVEEKLQKQKTYWEACIFFMDNRLWLVNANTIKWNGRSLESRLQVPVTEAIEFRKRYNNCIKRYKVCMTHVEVRDKVVFVINDLTRGAIAQTALHARNNNETVLLLNFKDNNHKEEFFKVLDLPNTMYMKASELPKVKRSPNTYAGKKIVYEFNYYGDKIGSTWLPKELKNVTTGVYVELDHWEPIGFAGTNKLRCLVRSYVDLKIDVKVYGVRKNVLKKIVANPAWESFTDFIVKTQKLHEANRGYILNAEQYLCYGQLKIFKDKVSGIDINALIAKIEHVEKNKKEYSKLLPIIGWGVSHEDEVRNCQELKDIDSKYPLLRFIMDNVNDNWPTSDLVDYIKLINERKM